MGIGHFPMMGKDFFFCSGALDLAPRGWVFFVASTHIVLQCCRFGATRNRRIRLHVAA